MPYVPPDVPVSILNVLMDAVVDRLALVLITDADDDAEAGLVRAGKLQDDPTGTLINVLIHPGGPDWPHILNETDTGPSMFAPTYEIGGGVVGRSFQGTVTFRRRFVVELKLFLDNEPYRLRAQIIAQSVLSRAIWALLSMNLPNTIDAFGESAHMIQVGDNFIRESGGEGTFIWRGEIRLEFLTFMSPA